MGFSLPILGHAFHIPNWSMQIPAAAVGDSGALPAGWTLTAQSDLMRFAGRRDGLFQAGRHRAQAVRMPAHSGTYNATLTSPVATPPLPTVNPSAFPYYFAASRAQAGENSLAGYFVAWFDEDGAYLSETHIASALGPTAATLDVYSGNLTPPADAHTLAVRVRCYAGESAEVQEWLFAGAILAFGWATLSRYPWFPGTVATPVGASGRAHAIGGRRIRTDHSRDAMRRSLAFQLGSVSLSDRNLIERFWQANRGLAPSTGGYRLASCPPILVLPGTPGMPPMFVGECEDERFPLALDGWASDAQQLYAGTLNLSEIL